ncbi:MAG: type VI secretion system tip protein VgrG, partial [Myxococcales bacterium]|nr:type VI secretion system tip protein VgrG [Myxococcales bacterium]
YGESDYDFMSRLLEEDGITYLLEQVDPDGKDEEESEEEEALPAMLVVLSEAPAATGRRFEVPIPYQGNTDDSDGTPHVRKVRIGRSLRPGRFSISSYDYRSSPELRLLVEARAGYELEERYEQHHHAPGAFLTEGRDETTQGLVVDEALGGRQAALGLERLRTRQRRLSMITNQLVIAPGCLFYLEGYPRPEIKDDTLLIATSRSIQGEHMKDWTIDLDAGFAADPIRPPLSTPKPRVMGVESALVVGPEGEEIHCDALGRVKIQFFWDRYGEHDEHSSCFVRVSQAWAGSGYGFSALPRIGHEVLVDFIEGDPDHPVIVGRAHHRGAVPPDTLPKDKTKTTWRSSSTPGGEGYNEISMNDARGEELLAIRAQKDLSHVVLGKEDVAIGIDLSTSVRGSEKRLVGRNQELEVKGDRTVQVDGNHSITTTRGFRAQSGRTTGLTCEDGKLVLTNGQASIVFDGPSIYVDTTANLRLSAGRLLSIYGRQVDVDGRPDVYINSGTYVGPDVATLPISTHSGEGGLPNQAPPEVHPIIAQNVAPEAPGGMKDAEFDGKGYLLDLINDQFGTKLKWPKAVKLPKEWDEQLEKLGRIAFKGNVVKGKLMDPATYQAMKDRLEARLEAEKDRVKKLVKDFGTIVHDQSAHYEDTFGKLKERLSLEKVNLSKLRTDLSDIFNGKKGNFIDSAKALGKVLKGQWNNVKALKKDLTAVWEEEVAYFNRFKEQWKQYSGEVKQVVQDFKDLINDPKDALLDIVFGEDKELAHDIANLADELGYGDQVSDFLGLGDAANVVPPPNPSPPMPNLSPGGVNGGGQLGKATGFGSVSGNQAMSVQNKAATLAPTKASEGFMKTGGQGPQAMTKGGPQALTQQKLSGTGPSDFGGGKLATTAPGLASGT